VGVSDNAHHAGRVDADGGVERDVVEFTVHGFTLARSPMG